MIWTVDAGDRWGIAAGSTTLTALQSGTGLDAFRATLAPLPRPDKIYLECPFIVWRPGSSKIEAKVSQALTWARQRDILSGFGPVEDLHPGSNGWQAIHAGHVDRDSKGRSLAVVLAAERRGMVAPGLIRREDGELADAAAMWVFVKGRG